MTSEQVLLGVLSLCYAGGWWIAVFTGEGEEKTIITDAFWWPIYAAKALLKSLYRALFTGWKL